METAVTVERLISQPVSADGSFPLALGPLKRFIRCMWAVPFYQTPASRKVMPLMMTELNDLNPDRSRGKTKFPGANPFFHHCTFLQYYVASKNGRDVGRVAAYIDGLYHEPGVAGAVGWVGLFEAVDDQEVVSALLEQATRDLEQHGAVKIIGPARFNANGEDGLLVEGFDQHPMVMQPYQPPYYASYFEEWGVKENDWYAFHITPETAAPYLARIDAIRQHGRDPEQRLRQQGVAIRSVSMKDWDGEIARIKAVYNTAWDSQVHPQFERFTDEEFAYLAAGLRMIAVEDLVFMVEDVDEPGHPAIGMAVTLPDLNEVIEDVDRVHGRYVPSTHVYGLGDIRRDLMVFVQLRRRVKKRAFRNVRVLVLGTVRKRDGIDALLYEKTYRAGAAIGVEMASGSQIADTNPEIYVPLSRMGSAALTWRIYRHTAGTSEAGPKPQ